ncbi:MAG: DNA/RNA nuclease SfsA [Firmicutes bacterium HGW-Firmicutes-7]|nr:MAG: DNA/RNA nuclease SfsA [Firmicutes bacterium HGW-Firmicutes-7]
MIYDNIVEGIFLERINRFIARVIINDHEVLVHVKNTGRCKELFIAGAKVFLQKSNNPNRKTGYSLISIYKNNLLINIDSQVPNAVVYEGILDKKLDEFSEIITLKREVTYGNSRFDLYYETPFHKGFIEVKGVTLERNGIASFPDAPTERGKKHIMELIHASKEGYTNYVFFLIQMDGIRKFVPNNETDPNFAEALMSAQQLGVKVLLFNSKVDIYSIYLNERL